MLVEKTVICILTFVALLVFSMIFEATHEFTRISKIVAGIAVVLGITFCVLLITTNWNLYTILKILVFISVCLFIVLAPLKLSIVVTAIVLITAGFMYLNDFVKTKVSDVSTTTTTVIYAKDNSSSTGSISGNILYVDGSILKESIYEYYYQSEDGGIKKGTIPANSTTIYFIKAGEKPHLETIVTKKYWKDNNNSSATQITENSTKSYKLYVPEGSIIDAE